MTKNNTVTADDIKALRREAECAGDDDMARICNRALGGDTRARAECARVVSEARLVAAGDND